MTEQLERKLHALREQAEASVPMADFTELESRGNKMKRTRYAVGAGVAAAIIAIGAGVAANLGGDTDAIDPVDTETPVEIAEAFVEAVHDSGIDIDQAQQRLADGGAGEITADNLEYLRMLEDAEGFTSLGADCQERTDDGARALVDCTVTFHKIGSEERGLGPYEISGLVEVADGKVTSWEAGTSYGGGPVADPAYVDEIMRPYLEWQDANVDPAAVESIMDMNRALFDQNYTGEPVTRADVEEIADLLRSLLQQYLASLADD